MYQTGGRAKFYTFLYIYVVLILDKQNKLCGKCEKPRRKSNQEPNPPKAFNYIVQIIIPRFDCNWDLLFICTISTVMDISSWFLE